MKTTPSWAVPNRKNYSPPGAKKHGTGESDQTSRRQLTLTRLPSFGMFAGLSAAKA